VAIPRGEIACPVAALRAWLVAGGITEGAIFRRVVNKRAQRVTARRLAARNVATIVKAAATKLGLDASAFAGHSLRAGFVTSAVKRGANLIKITDVTAVRTRFATPYDWREGEGVCAQHGFVVRRHARSLICAQD
jgi:hypothetical protein